LRRRRLRHAVARTDPELLRQVKEQLAWLGVDLLGAVYNDL
jgi:hypothetical protein